MESIEISPKPRASSLELFMRRRNFFTHKSLQLRFAIACSALIFTSTIGAWILMHWVMKNLLSGEWGTGYGLEMLHRTNLIIWGVVLADVMAVFLISISFSHTVAGPLYRIEKGLADLVETGEARTISLRKYDLLKDTAEKVNRVILKFGKPLK